ncbi:helix-turn-helix transcriptional regulator [Pseudodonghicola flavimaris]|uniref:Autoinducer binding domain-containing protein n=1 Tax=Pseudodonghicola flavimaris TaxID=3050036 RepID=A0ABT7F5A3_9RHOB|nr:autoinducer binding domain-containing protein [Pseudodonghicola flavimaris]MDK3019789.1 autoinducer binding domain-containing protein [Pseudodonghicola flavimaris]
MSLGDIDYLPQGPVQDRDGFLGEVERFLEPIGLKRFSYAAFSGAGEAASENFFKLETNYHIDWATRYQGLHYDQIDPVIEVARASRAPFLWGAGSFLKQFRKRQRQVFHEASEFGIAHGVSIPINGRLGLELVTFTAENRGVVRQAFAEHGGKLIVAGYHIADALNALDPVPEAAGEKTPLTPRERESLIWVAEGLTSQEIAEKMNISASAVNYHLNNAGQKLSARNRHHAALLALKKQWI